MKKLLAAATGALMCAAVGSAAAADTPASTCEWRKINAVVEAYMNGAFYGYLRVPDTDGGGGMKNYGKSEDLKTLKELAPEIRLLKEFLVLGIRERCLENLKKRKR